MLRKGYDESVLCRLKWTVGAFQLIIVDYSIKYYSNFNVISEDSCFKFSKERELKWRSFAQKKVKIQTFSNTLYKCSWPRRLISLFSAFNCEGSGSFPGSAVLPFCTVVFGLPFTASQYCFGKVIPVWSFPAFYFMHAMEMGTSRVSGDSDIFT